MGSAPVAPPTTPAGPMSAAVAPASLHFIEDRREIMGGERATCGGEEHGLLDVDVRAVCVFQRGRDPPEVLELGRLRDGALEPLVQGDVRDVLVAQLVDDRREVGDVREAREERDLFVVLVTTHLAREEVRDVARRRLVETVFARDLGQHGEAFFEPAMRTRQLLEGIAHFLPKPICWRIGIASFSTRWNDGRSITRLAYAVRFLCSSNGSTLRA